MLKTITLWLGFILSLVFGHQPLSVATTPVSDTHSPTYAVGIGTMSGAVTPLRSAQDGQTKDTYFSTNPAGIARVLLDVRYFQVNSVITNGKYTYPWHFQRTDRRHESIAIITFGYNEVHHTRVIAVGIATGALLAVPQSGHTASGGALPNNVASPTATLRLPTDCGISCSPGQTLYPAITGDTAYFDPLWIKLNEGKINLNCTENNTTIYNCHGWWWAYWADDGWQLNSYNYGAPYAFSSQLEMNYVSLYFEHPWFCAGQPTYVTYDPEEVRIGLFGYTTDAYSWSGASGACKGLLTSVVYA